MAFLQIRLPLRDRSGGYKPPDFTLREQDGYYTIGLPGSPLVRLRKRTAYPSTYAEEIMQGVIIFGYGPRDPESSDEFLQIVLDSMGNMAIKRDICATLPIFYGKTSDEFLLSNDYGFIAESIPSFTLNETKLLDTLLPSVAHRQPFWDELSILGGQQTLEIQASGDLTVQHSYGRPWQASANAEPSDPRTFKSVLDGSLDLVMAKIGNENCAFEVSGGLDSATLPLYWTRMRRDERSPVFGSMIFPGPFGVSQQKKLEALATASNASSITVPMDPATDYPLARMIKKSAFYAHYSFDDSYTEVLEKLASRFAENGVQIVLTGIGGDDIFEHRLSLEEQLMYGRTERQRRERLAYPSFITPRARALYINATPATRPYPLPLLPVSVHATRASRNNIYINRDIWPVSPFINFELYRFCQGLPAHFLINKTILRAYHEAYAFPEMIYNPTEDENFGPFFEASLMSGKYDEIIHSIAKYSITQELGLIDVQRLLATYEASKHDPIEGMQLFYIYRWLDAEINLQLGRQKKSF